MKSYNVYKINQSGAMTIEKTFKQLESAKKYTAKQLLSYGESLGHPTNINGMLSYEIREDGKCQGIKSGAYHDYGLRGYQASTTQVYIRNIPINGTRTWDRYYKIQGMLIKDQSEESLDWYPNKYI